MAATSNAGRSHFHFSKPTSYAAEDGVEHALGLLDLLNLAEGSLFLIRAAASGAYPSKGFRMLGTPSPISVFFTGLILISVVSGTCLTHTITFILHFLPI